jgi:hypothetical protein
MKLPYPQSVNCSFDGFPAAIAMTCGERINEIEPGESYGSRQRLFQTPKSRVLQGEYVVGQAIPDLAVTYSDTGSDDDFSIKLSHIGYGTFYKLTKSDKYFRAMVYKAIVIETPTAGKKVFGDTFDCETLIPADTDTTALFSYDGPAIQYVDTATSGSASGTIVIGGQTYNLAEGASITITSATGGTQTVTFVGGTFVVN